MATGDSRRGFRPPRPLTAGASDRPAPAGASAVTPPVPHAARAHLWQGESAVRHPAVSLSCGRYVGPRTAGRAPRHLRCAPRAPPGSLPPAAHHQSRRAISRVCRLHERDRKDSVYQSWLSGRVLPSFQLQALPPLPILLVETVPAVRRVHERAPAAAPTAPADGLDLPQGAARLIPSPPYPLRGDRTAALRENRQSIARRSSPMPPRGSSPGSIPIQRQQLPLIGASASSRSPR
jgi:hypothetical protein